MSYEREEKVCCPDDGPTKKQGEITRAMKVLFESVDILSISLDGLEHKVAPLVTPGLADDCEKPSDLIPGSEIAKDIYSVAKRVSFAINRVNELRDRIDL